MRANSEGAGALVDASLPGVQGASNGTHLPLAQRPGLRLQELWGHSERPRPGKDRCASPEIAFAIQASLRTRPSNPQLHGVHAPFGAA